LEKVPMGTDSEVPPRTSPRTQPFAGCCSG
jgi:hypothetical protein